MNKITERKQQRYYILFYFLSYFSFGIVMSNFTPFLSTLGYDTMQRGILLSSYAITTILFQMLFGVLADRYQTMKKIILLSIVGFALCSAVLFFQNGVMFSLHLIIVAFSGGLLNTLCGLYDTWVLSTSQKLANRLSFIKAFGSVGWAVGSFLAFYLIMFFSYKGMAISICLIMILALLTMKQMPDMKQIKRSKKTNLRDVIALCKDKQYVLLIVILFLLYSMVVANNCTVIDKMIELGASQSDISWKWSLQSLLEIPTYMLGSKLLLRYRSTSLLQFSAAMLILQFFLFALASTPFMMIAFSMFQLFSTPLLMITSKSLIQTITKPELRGSSQMIALSIFTGLSSLFVPAIAGSLCMTIGINTTLCSLCGLGILAFLLLIYLRNTMKESIK